MSKRIRNESIQDICIHNNFIRSIGEREKDVKQPSSWPASHLIGCRLILIDSYSF